MTAKDTSPNTSSQGEFSSQVVDIPKLNSTITTLTEFIAAKPHLSPEGGDSQAQEFAAKAAAQAAEFKTGYEKETNILDADTRKKLSEWVHADESEAGAHQLKQVAQAMIRFWRGVGRKEGTEQEKKMAGHPAHDKRHLLEDLMAGLVFRCDVVTDTGASNDEYQKLGLPGSFMHDIGRLAEVRVTKKQQGGESGDKHAEMSFYITKQLLDCFPTLDQRVRDHMLYSILMHQQWPKKELENTVGYKMTMNEPLNRSVMGSDRLQLVGPESVLRFIAFDIGEADVPLSFDAKIKPERKAQLDNKAETDLVEHIEFYLRNLLPVEVRVSSAAANQKVNKHAVELKAISGAFLILSTKDEIWQQIFAPELARDRGERVDEVKLAENKKRILTPDVWAEIKNQIVLAQGKGSDPSVKAQIDTILGSKPASDLAVSLVSAENASLTAKGLSVIKNQVGKVTDPVAADRLKRGLAYALVMRDQHDREMLKTVASIQNNPQLFPNHTLERTFAQFVLNNFSQTLQKAA